MDHDPRSEVEQKSLGKQSGNEIQNATAWLSMMRNAALTKHAAGAASQPEWTKTKHATKQSDMVNELRVAMQDEVTKDFFY